jgi:beta-lactamase class A
MLDRRTFLTALAAAPPLLSVALPAFAHAAADLNSRINDLEQRSGGRLGVAVLDTQTGRRFAWRGDQRFRMCSTFKMHLSAAILRRVDQGRERLDRRISYGSDVLMGNSPVVEKNLGQGMTVGELCEATITWSDNAAANLLLDALGGSRRPDPLPAGDRRRDHPLRPSRTRAEHRNTRRSARHHDADGDPGHLEDPAARRHPRPRLAPPADRLAGGQQDRRQAPASRPAARLAGRRQDRQQRPGHHQRHRHRLAARPQAPADRGLP